jgi:hypothetical protein
MSDILQNVHQELAITNQFQRVPDQKWTSILMRPRNE